MDDCIFNVSCVFGVTASFFTFSRQSFSDLRQTSEDVLSDLLCAEKKAVTGAKPFMIIFAQHPDKVACIFKQPAKAVPNKRLRF
jgi:hypothetical protein